MAGKQQVTVLDARGRELAPCPTEKADRLVSSGQAVLVSEYPAVIQLDREVDIPQPAPQPEVVDTHAGKRILLHICCAPCGTYTINRLRDLEFDVAGFWYNPNIHPWEEHERRRESLVDYAERIDLPMIWHPDYEMPAFLRKVSGNEQFRRRCAHCYEMRLAETARVARDDGYEAFTTTLLISPYQDQEMIRRVGERLGERAGVEFYFENFRRGWSERSQLAKEFDLYRQSYCGCIFSEWERYNGAEIDAILPTGNGR
jgi:predicted adenine nucleotide alpha hydrolase (AANH) superfamily ATPase